VQQNSSQGHRSQNQRTGGGMKRAWDGVLEDVPLTVSDKAGDINRPHTRIEGLKEAVGIIERLREEQSPNYYLITEAIETRIKELEGE